MLRNLCLAVLITLGLSVGCVTVSEKIEEVVTNEQITVDEQAASYVHGWNLHAYVNGLNVSYYDKKNSAGERVFIAVNIDINFSNKEEVAVFKYLIERISFEWYDITDSKAVNFFSSNGILIMWIDGEGKLHSISQKKKGKNV